MKAIYIVAATLSLAGVLAVAQDSKKAEGGKSSEAPKKIGALDATNYYDKMMIVTGKVARVSVTPKIAYIDIDKAYPNSPFNAIVFSSATNQFGNLKELKGKNVELTGKIAKYRDKPQIVLNSSNQLHVVDVKPAESKPADAK